MTDTELWVSLRQALLMAVDAIERRLNTQPRTAELRKETKRVGTNAQ